MASAKKIFLGAMKITLSISFGVTLIGITLNINFHNTASFKQEVTQEKEMENGKYEIRVDFIPEGKISSTTLQITIQVDENTIIERAYLEGISHSIEVGNAHYKTLKFDVPQGKQAFIATFNHRPEFKKIDWSPRTKS